MRPRWFIVGQKLQFYVLSLLMRILGILMAQVSQIVFALQTIRLLNLEGDQETHSTPSSVLHLLKYLLRDPKNLSTSSVDLPEILLFDQQFSVYQINILSACLYISRSSYLPWQQLKLHLIVGFNTNLRSLRSVWHCDFDFIRVQLWGLSFSISFQMLSQWQR